MYLITSIILTLAAAAWDYIRCDDDVYVMNNAHMVVGLAIFIFGPFVLLTALILCLVVAVAWLFTLFLEFLTRFEIRINKHKSDD